MNSDPLIRSLASMSSIRFILITLFSCIFTFSTPTAAAPKINYAANIGDLPDHFTKLLQSHYEKNDPYGAWFLFEASEPSGPKISHPYMGQAAVGLDFDLPVFALERIDKALKRKPPATERALLYQFKIAAHEALNEPFQAYETYMAANGSDADPINPHWLAIFSGVHGAFAEDIAISQAARLLATNPEPKVARMLIHSLNAAGAPSAATSYWEQYKDGAIPDELRAAYLQHVLDTFLEDQTSESRKNMERKINAVAKGIVPSDNDTHFAKITTYYPALFYAKTKFGDDDVKSPFSIDQVESELLKLDEHFAKFEAFLAGLSELIDTYPKGSEKRPPSFQSLNDAEELFSKIAKRIEIVYLMSGNCDKSRAFYEPRRAQALAAIEQANANGETSVVESLNQLALKIEEKLSTQRVFDANKRLRSKLLVIANRFRSQEALTFKKWAVAAPNNRSLQYAFTTALTIDGYDHQSLWESRLDSSEGINDKHGAIHSAMKILMDYPSSASTPKARELLTAYKEEADIHYILAARAFSAGKGDEGYENILKAQAHDPSEKTYLEEGYKIAMLRQNDRDAVIQLRTLWMAGGGRSLDLNQAVQLALTNGDWRLSLAISTEAVRRSPLDEYTNYLFSLSCTAWGLPSFAEEAFLKIENEELRLDAAAPYLVYRVPTGYGYKRFPLHQPALSPSYFGSDSYDLGEEIKKRKMHEDWLPILLMARYTYPYYSGAASTQYNNHRSGLRVAHTLGAMGSHLKYLEGSLPLSNYQKSLTNDRDQAMGTFVQILSELSKNQHSNKVSAKDLEIVFNRADLPLHLRLAAHGLYARLIPGNGYQPLSSSDPQLADRHTVLSQGKGHAFLFAGHVVFSDVVKAQSTPFARIISLYNDGFHLLSRNAAPSENYVVDEDAKRLQSDFINLAFVGLSETLKSALDENMASASSYGDRVAALTAYRDDFLKYSALHGLNPKLQSEYIFKTIDPYIRRYSSEAANYFIDIFRNIEPPITYLSNLPENIKSAIRSSANDRIRGYQKPKPSVVTAKSFVSNIPANYRGLFKSYDEYNRWIREQQKEANYQNMLAERERRKNKRNQWRQNLSNYNSNSSSSTYKSWESTWSSDYRNQVYRNQLNQQISRSMGGYGW